MSAVDTLKRGDLDAALAELTGEVRSDPANPKKRIFLFQLLCLTGAWDRAKIQLDTVVEMDPESALMAKVYGGAIACEAERRKIFSGETTPTIFGDPLPWMAELCEALRLDAKGEHEAAATLRGRAFDAAPTSSGRIDDAPFAWIADADARLGPVVEAIINGRYFWLPFLRLERITLDEPTDLRDQVWMPVQFRFSNGGETVGLIPTRYAGSEAAKDPLVRLSRKTEWVESGEGGFEGRGQRLFATDIGEHPLMDVRRIELAPAADAGDG